MRKADAVAPTPTLLPTSPCSLTPTCIEFKRESRGDFKAPFLAVPVGDILSRTACTWRHPKLDRDDRCIEGDLWTGQLEPPHILYTFDFRSRNCLSGLIDRHLEQYDRCWEMRLVSPSRFYFTVAGAGDKNRLSSLAGFQPTRCLRSVLIGVIFVS